MDEHEVDFWQHHNCYPAGHDHDLRTTLKRRQETGWHLVAVCRDVDGEGDVFYDLFWRRPVS